MQDLQALAEYTRFWMDEHNLSTHRVSQKSGRAISHATVGNILNCAVKEVKESTIYGLAAGLGRPPEEIFSVVRGKKVGLDNPMEEIRVLLAGLEDASEEDRESTMEAIRMIAESFQRRRRRPKK
jgi:transcriptional regulator with XRE-family HTH domain